MKITEVTLYTVHGEWDSPDNRSGSRQAQMLDIYPEFNARDWAAGRNGGKRAISATYVEILTEEGVSGIFGPIELDQAFVISHFLRPFLLGRDALATEALYDQMLRLNRHGRSGLFMTGVSAVDCALWDLKGKAWGQPIYRLLGGPTRPAAPAYASMLGYSVEPAQAASLAQQFQQQGYCAQKWFFRYGPADGAEGMAKNIAMIQAVRQTVGPYYMLMADAFMGWDLPYAMQMAQALEPFNLAWLEEPLPPEHVGSFQKLKQSTRTPLATGEHVYTRWQVRELLAAGAVDVIQTDPDWTGGISELVKIATLCSAYDVPLFAHGHSLLAALHVAAASSPSVSPMVEYLVQFQPEKQFFHNPTYQPENGLIRMPDLPGLGLVVDKEKVMFRSEVTF